MGRKRKEQASLDAATVVTYDAADAAEILFADVDTAPEPVVSEVAPVEPVSVPVSNPSKWLVLQDQVVSLFGQMTNLPAGTIVSIGSYGPIGVKRIMEQGVIMEPLE